MIELSAEDFRKKLAGYINPSQKHDEVGDQSIKHEAVFFLSILPTLYGDELERMKLWDRISSGVKTSIQKSNGDIEEFISAILEHIKADPSKVASNTELKDFLLISSARGKEWRDSFIDVLEKKLFVILVLAREKWNNKKELNGVVK
jgi:hypothetical protein